MEDAVRIFLYTSFLIAAINGNVLLFFSLFRYKVLRTVHDALIADFAVVDFLNCVVIIPLSIHFVVLERFHVKSFVWALSFLHSFFILNSLSTLMLQMVDRYLAISFPVTYKAKKSWTKIIAVISFKWFAILTITLSVYVPVYHVDIGKSTAFHYRKVYARETEEALPKYVVPFLVVIILILGALSLRNLKRLKHPRQVRHIARVPTQEHSLSSKARKKSLYTILLLLSITATAYLLAAIKVTVWFGLSEAQMRQWLTLVIAFLLFVLFRVKKFTDKLKTLMNSVKGICSRSNQVEDENVASQNVHDVIQQLFRLSNQSFSEAQRGGLGIREGYCGCAHS